jgi:ElaB/YqjD/DUF883 family membrane-anchored ribosome-binding protein
MNLMRKLELIKELVKVLGLAGLSIAAVMLLLEVRSELPKFRADLNATLRESVRDEGDKTRTLIRATLSELMEKVDAHADHLQERSDAVALRLEADLIKAINKGIDRVDYRVAQAESLLDVQLTRTNQSISLVAATAVPAREVLEQLRSDVMPSVSESSRSAAKALDQVALASQSIPSTLESVKKAADEASKTMVHVTGIAADAHKLADKVVGPKPWYYKVYAVAKAAATVYFLGWR